MEDLGHGTELSEIRFLTSHGTDYRSSGLAWMLVISCDSGMGLVVSQSFLAVTYLRLRRHSDKVASPLCFEST